MSGLISNKIFQFCSYSNVLGWLQNHLIPCPLKYLTGFDCPLCGFQRSVLALLQGQWMQSVGLYPATIPILIIAIYFAVKQWVFITVKLQYQNLFYGSTAAIILIAYAFKLVHYF